MVQTVFNEKISARIEGQLADGSMHKDVITKTNTTRKLININVVNAVNDADYDLLIDDGVNAPDTATFTADGSATTTEIVAGVVAAVDALGLNVNATAVDADDFLIESTSADAGFTISSTGDTPSDLAITNLVEQGQELPFGRVVVRDENRGDKFVRLPRLTGDVTGGTDIGVVLADTSKEFNAGGHKDKTNVPVLRNGRVIMRCEDAVVLGGDVFVRFVAGAGEELGTVRSDADGSDAVALPGAQFRETGIAGALVIVELR